MNRAIILFLVVLFLFYFWEDIKINYIVFLVINRGILAPNCFWWGVSNRFLKDASGVNLYYDLKEKYEEKIIDINMLGTPIHLVMDIDYIRDILDQSPFVFGVGKLKYQMFQTFMPGNVGVSQGLEWVNRRTLNEQVLDTNQIHQYATYFDGFINESLGQKPTVPTNFEQFSRVSQCLTNKIVFNSEDINPDVYQIFSEANSLQVFFNPNYQIDPRVFNSYEKYLDQSLANPSFPSLVELSRRYSEDLEDLKQQIPHWIFPIGALPGVSFPRMLLLLINHPDKFQKVIDEINCLQPHDPIVKQISELSYLRKCILETLRLNNPVVTTFRTLLEDYSFDSEHQYQKGDQFLILNNPILRSPDYFHQPNKFLPERWTDLNECEGPLGFGLNECEGQKASKMEESYYAIMFNQGPQKCPGKDLAVFILQSFTVHYFRQSGLLASGPTAIQSRQIDTNNIPQMMDPCQISFQFKK